MATPDWTDHDVSDPGVTLIDLFPFLGEQLQRGTGRIEFAELPHQYLQLTPLVGRSYEVEKALEEGDNLGTS